MEVEPENDEDWILEEPEKDEDWIVEEPEIDEDMMVEDWLKDCVVEG